MAEYWRAAAHAGDLDDEFDQAPILTDRSEFPSIIAYILIDCPQARAALNTLQASYCHIRPVIHTTIMAGARRRMSEIHLTFYLDFTLHLPFHLYSPPPASLSS